MRHIVRFGPALANRLVQYLTIGWAIMAIVIAAVIWKGVAMTPAGWQLVLAVFTGAPVLSALMSSVSALFNYYAVDAGGIRYRTIAGMGLGTLALKQSGFAPWEDIVAARTSRRLPFRTITLTVDRASGGQQLTITLPLHVRDPRALLRDFTAHAPVGHPLRLALGL
jgi:hypothetical protein